MYIVECSALGVLWRSSPVIWSGNTDQRRQNGRHRFTNTTSIHRLRTSLSVICLLAMCHILIAGSEGAGHDQTHVGDFSECLSLRPAAKCPVPGVCRCGNPTTLQLTLVVKHRCLPPPACKRIKMLSRRSASNPQVDQQACRRRSRRLRASTLRAQSGCGRCRVLTSWLRTRRRFRRTG